MVRKEKQAFQETKDYKDQLEIQGSVELQVKLESVDNLDNLVQQVAKETKVLKAFLEMLETLGLQETLEIKVRKMLEFFF